MNNQPNFFILGAQKCGTTWLHQALNEHSDIYMSPEKEIHFFNSKKHFKRGMNHYKSFFKDSKNEPLKGESTPNYFWTSTYKDEYLKDGCDSEFMHGIPKRIRQNLGENLKFIILLRNPVDRAISAFYHHLKFDSRLNLDVSFDENIRNFGIAQMGFYAEHLKHYYTLFNPNQFKVLIYEEFFKDPQLGLNEALSFLSLPKKNDFSILSNSIHSSKKKVKINGEYYIHLSKHQVKKIISKQNISTLRALYKKENLKLNELLKKDINWA